VYRDGSLVHRDWAIASGARATDAGADVVAYWRELEGLEGVEWVVDDLAVRCRPGQILEPEAGQTDSDDAYPWATGPGRRAERSPETNHANAIMRSIDARAFDAVGSGTVTS
jgi:hypothetical protein